MKKFRLHSVQTLLVVLICSLTSTIFTACSDDEPENKDYDATLFSEWIENDGNSYVHGWIVFYSDGTGISGSYESDIDWINEEDDFVWYTVDDEYLYINGSKYEYWCNGSSLTIYNYYGGKDRSYSCKD